MKRYLVRQSCEYSLLVEAENEKEAFEKAGKCNEYEWDEAWSGFEVDEQEG